MANYSDRAAQAFWGALLSFRWFGKHVDEDALLAAYEQGRAAVAAALLPASAPRVVVVRMADDWEALYVEGQLVFDGYHVGVEDLGAHLPDLRIDTIEVTEGQWGAWGYRAPKTLEEL